MKNTKLTKNMKHDIAHKMYDVHHSKAITMWREFIPEIQSYCPMVTQVLHYGYNQIENNITDYNWFRDYITTGKYH